MNNFHYYVIYATSFFIFIGMSALYARSVLAGAPRDMVAAFLGKRAFTVYLTLLLVKCEPEAAFAFAGYVAVVCYGEVRSIIASRKAGQKFEGFAAYLNN